jgi:outer membrane biosynthesis protein TonB
VPILRQGTRFPSAQTAVRRTAVGIWRCKGCKLTYAGGAYELSTTVATTAKITMHRLKKLNEEPAAEVVEEKKKEDKEKKPKEARQPKKERPEKLEKKEERAEKQKEKPAVAAKVADKPAPAKKA